MTERLQRVGKNHRAHDFTAGDEKVKFPGIWLDGRVNFFQKVDERVGCIRGPFSTNGADDNHRLNAFLFRTDDLHCRDQSGFGRRDARAAKFHDINFRHLPLQLR